MIGELVDRVVSVFSPQRGLARMHARATMQQIAAFSNSQGGYAAGKRNRVTATWSRTDLTENQVPAGQIEQIRANSWGLYRDNPHARKIVRSLESKVIGRGMHPQPLVKTVDGEPHTAFRQRARQLWWEFAKACDVRGVPGRGGIDLVEMQKLALRSVVLSGECLTRLYLAKRAQSPSPIGLRLQMVDGRRLSTVTKADGFVDGSQFYRGIELDSDGLRVAYHLQTSVVDELLKDQISYSRVPSSEMIHLFVQEDIDQLRGVPWFAAAIFQIKDTGDLQYNVLKASAVAACFAVGYKLGTGQTKLGLNGTGNDASQLTDDDGNRISRLQPGMLINLGQNGSLEAVSPAQPTTNIEAFIQHLLRGAAGSVPGVKASTVTGDYRNSSFSSERSADNDCWPEIEGVQDWFAASWCQPVYEQVIREGILSGYFAGVVSSEEFADREREFLDTAWKGPVARSINPTDDQEASKRRVANGVSSPQIECATQGAEPLDVIRDVSEWVQMCESAGLPDWYISASLGQANPVTINQGAANAEQTDATT